MTIKKRILWLGDGVTPTGFSRVNHNIIKNLPKEEFEVHHLAINYFGDPHNYDWSIYPAATIRSRNMWGYGRLPEFTQANIEGIFILNDIWVIDKYLKEIKKHFNKIPPIIVYFPVDSKELDPAYFDEFDIVTKFGVYTKFAYNEVKLSREDLDPEIIPHGVDTTTFFKINESKQDIRKKIFPKEEDFDSFIVLNANRNQPRKRIELTMKGFKEFSLDKPKNVKLYLHMGLRGLGLDIIKKSVRLGIDDRLIITGDSGMDIQIVPDSYLNVIYNSCNVGVNTGFGEGWSLTNMEHGVTGAPQIVPDHSALTELYSDCGLLVPIAMELDNYDVMTVGSYVKPEDVASKLEEIYTNKDLYDSLSYKTMSKFSSKEYSWKYIVDNQWIPMLKEVYF